MGRPLLPEILGQPTPIMLFLSLLVKFVNNCGTSSLILLMCCQESAYSLTQ